MTGAIGNENSKNLWFRHGTVMELFHDGLIVDGRSEGLIVGRSHDEGNIYLLQQVESDKYLIPASIEGYEYLVGHYAYLEFREKIEEINSWSQPTPALDQITVSLRTRVINTTGSPSDKFVLMDMRGQFVINKFATSKFLEEIEKINHQSGDFTEAKLNIVET